MKRVLKVGMCVATSIGAIALAVGYATLPPVLSRDEQELIEAAIAQSPYTATEKMHVLDYQTFDPVFSGHGREKAANELRNEVKLYKPALADVLEDFLTKTAKKKTRLRFARSLPPNIKLLPRLIALRARLVNRDYFSTVLRHYPAAEGVISVSRAGISTDGSVGMVALQHYSSGMSGAGRILIFHRIRGKWVFQPDATLGGMWMS